MTIVYTAILGGSDSLKPPPHGADRCVCFVDDPSKYYQPNGWELAWHGYKGDSRREAWRLRCLPHMVFPLHEYDRVVWIDASFTLTDLPRLLNDAGDAPVAALRHHRRSTWQSEARELVKVGQARHEDIDRQIRDYTKAGFTSPHLSISCVIVRYNIARARRFSETWQAQITEFPGDNTQVSLDFSAWANAFEITALRGTRHDNPYSTHDGADHKKRRKPYQLPAEVAS